MAFILKNIPEYLQNLWKHKYRSLYGIPTKEGEN